MSAELKNCPFCGGEAKLIEGEECAYVQCLQVKCHRGPFVDGDNAAADEAVEHWNRRTDLSQAAHVAAEVVKARAEWVKAAKEKIDGMFMSTKVETAHSVSYDPHADWYNRGLRNALAQIGAKP